MYNLMCLILGYIFQGKDDNIYLCMRHLRLYKESQGKVLYREMSTMEWSRIAPRSLPPREGTPQVLHLDIDGFQVPARLAIIEVVTDPVSPVMVTKYIDMMKDALGIREDMEYMEVVISTLDPEYGNKRYRMAVDRHNLGRNFAWSITHLLSSGKVDVHYIAIDNSDRDTVSVLFLEDDWVLVRFLGFIMDDDELCEVNKSYKCDGFNGTKQCLEMIKKWKKS